MKPNLTVLAWLALLGCVCGHSAAWAGSFQQAYEAALLNDPGLQAARAEFVSTQQNVPLARAGLLPSVSFSMSEARVNGTRSLDNPPGSVVVSPLDYRAPSQSLNIRAPLYNREASQKLMLAETQVIFAQAVFATRKLDLLDRLANAYLQRLQAMQALQAAMAQRDAAQSQHGLARRRLQWGEGTRPEVLDAEAALDSAQVLVTDAQNQITVATLSLRQITGVEICEPVAKCLAFDAQHIALAGAAEWDAARGQDAVTSSVRLTLLLDQAQASNPTLVARRMGVEVAQAAVERNDAGHYPRLDFVASASKSRNESVSTLNQSVEQRSLGLQLSVPLYSGGAVSASVSQALADRDKAQAELAAEQQSVALDLTKLFYTVANGAARIASRQKTLVANRLALEGAQKGLAAGFSSTAEVAQAQAKLAQSGQDLIQTVYEVLLARVRLSVRAGSTPEEVVAKTDSLLP